VILVEYDAFLLNASLKPSVLSVAHTCVLVWVFLLQTYKHYGLSNICATLVYM
jgi:hypothetical protein